MKIGAKGKSLIKKAMGAKAGAQKRAAGGMAGMVKTAMAGAGKPAGRVATPPKKRAAPATRRPNTARPGAGRRSY